MIPVTIRVDSAEAFEGSSGGGEPPSISCFLTHVLLRQAATSFTLLNILSAPPRRPVSLRLCLFPLQYQVQPQADARFSNHSDVSRVSSLSFRSLSFSFRSDKPNATSLPSISGIFNTLQLQRRPGKRFLLKPSNLFV